MDSPRGADEEWSFSSPLLSYSYGYSFQQQQQQQQQECAPAAPLAIKIQQLQSLLLQVAEQDKADAFMEQLIDELTEAAKRALSQPSSSSSRDDDNDIVIHSLGGFDLETLQQESCSYPNQEEEDATPVEQYLLQHTSSIEEDEGDDGEEDEDEHSSSSKQQQQQKEKHSFELVELDEGEILAEHRHFCSVCGKGFKRDANLRMHMRGHGEQYKSAAALCKPEEEISLLLKQQQRRYSCPYVGCKRNRAHPRFAPLKTLLCIRNHYRRSHCPKLLLCAKCGSKRFSVLADLRTHEKHCGSNEASSKWSCSCGSVFSRKDKLLGHTSLFRGHSPMPPLL